MCKSSTILAAYPNITTGAGVCAAAAAAAMAILLCRREVVNSSSSKMTIGSFNALQRGFERKNYATYVSEEVRSWKYRQVLLKKLLPTLGDIIAVQECEIETFEEDFGFMSDHGYDYIAPFDKTAVKDPSKRRLAKTATFFKKSKFELIWHSHRSRTLLCAVVERTTQHMIWMVNCHLEGHPMKVSQRVSQIASAFRSIESQQRKMKLQPEECNIVVCGDFNCSSECTPVDFVLNGSLNEDDRDPWNTNEPVTKSHISHCYKMSRATNGAKTFLGSSGNSQTIDFIFLSKNFTTEIVREPYTRSQWKDALKTSVPNKWHPSDHFPVAVAVSLS